MTAALKRAPLMLLDETATIEDFDSRDGQSHGSPARAQQLHLERQVLLSMSARVVTRTNPVWMRKLVATVGIATGVSISLITLVKLLIE